MCSRKLLQKNRSKMFFRCIYVNCNAWQYVGCETLWAEIIKSLVEKIEQDLGVYTTRVFRLFSLDLIERTVFKVTLTQSTYILNKF